MIVKAKITAPEGYRCAPSGARVETFSFGDVVTGKVAEWAVADHAASAMFDPVEERKVVKPAERKRKAK